MITKERINAYDVVVTGPESEVRDFIQALRKAGLRAWKLQDGAYQVSLAGHPELMEELPPIGTIYETEGRKMSTTQTKIPVRRANDTPAMEAAHRPNLDRALVVAPGPVLFLTSDGRPLDEGKWNDSPAMLQHAIDIKAVTISVPTPDGTPIRFDASGQVIETVRPARETSYHPALGAMDANDYFGVRIGSPGVSSFLEWAEGQPGCFPEMPQVKWADFIRRYEGETGQAVYWESARPVAEQSGPDLARELVRAVDYLDSAANVVRTVAGRASPAGRAALNQVERTIFVAYGDLGNVVNELSGGHLASARSAQEIFLVTPVSPYLNWRLERDPRLGTVYVIQQGNVEASKWRTRGRWYAEIVNTAMGKLVDMFDDPSEVTVDNWVSANMPA